jgi:3-hydroxybutyryl-CoA dehydrogenase
MIQSLCVCGAGTMGSGIAQLMASHGITTTLYDVSSAMLAQALQKITSELDSLAGKKIISNDQHAMTLAHLRFTNDINECVADLIIEAIVEKLPEKTALFNQLAEINHSDTIFATNTSSLSITAIANAVQHPARVAGMHFFNPAPRMKLVEIISTSFTDPGILMQLTKLAIAVDKTVVACNDSPGFIVNRVARPYYLEALHLHEVLQIPIEQIDELMQATGFRMGPFKLMDLIGNDINYSVSCSVYEGLSNPARLKPSLLQQQKVKANELGMKTGKGYYQYKH